MSHEWPQFFSSFPEGSATEKQMHFISQVQRACSLLSDSLLTSYGYEN